VFRFDWCKDFNARANDVTRSTPATLSETKGIGRAAQQGRRGEYMTESDSQPLGKIDTSLIAYHLRV